MLPSADRLTRDFVWARRAISPDGHLLRSPAGMWPLVTQVL